MSIGLEMPRPSEPAVSWKRYKDKKSGADYFVSSDGESKCLLSFFFNLFALFIASSLWSLFIFSALAAEVTEVIEVKEPLQAGVEIVRGPKNDTMEQEFRYSHSRTSHGWYTNTVLKCFHAENICSFIHSFTIPPSNPLPLWLLQLEFQ